MLVAKAAAVGDGLADAVLFVEGQENEANAGFVHEIGNPSKVRHLGNAWPTRSVLSFEDANPIPTRSVSKSMSASKSVQTTCLFQFVANIQERLEEGGFSPDLVDAIVARGLSILFGLPEEEH